MKNILSVILLCIAFASHSQNGSYAIKNVSVITMTSPTAVADQTVLIEKNKITRIGKASQVSIPSGFEVIDGTGKFLMPGLFDMHTHFFSDQGEPYDTYKDELKLMVVNGITTARLMTGHSSYFGLRKDIRDGKLDGPELFIASPQLAGRWPFPVEYKNFELVLTPKQGAAAVKKYKAEGYDAIKITFEVKPDVYKAITKTAKAENIKVAGHVGPFVKLPAALAAGQQVEHMDQFIEMLLPDTSYNHGQSISDYNLYSQKAWATLPHLDESKIPALARDVKKAGIYVTPTNYFMVSCFGALPSDETVKAMPDYQFIPPGMKEDKWKARKRYQSRIAPAESLEKFVRIRRSLVKELWETGVPIMAGSDSPEYFIMQGFALHDELKELAAAGLTNYEVLQTATVIPARYLGLSSSTGTIEKGKEADLLLLDKNPLTDINNTRIISGVMENGKWYDAATLGRLRSEAAALGK